MKTILLFTLLMSISITAQIMKPQKFDGTLERKVSYDYLIYLPDGYETSKEEWPLLIFLHGSGERGDDLNKVKIHGVPKHIEKGEKFPFIVVAPQCKPKKWWRGEELVALLDHIEKEYRVDRSRIYVTGLSMGGYGTWSMALEAPERIAAIIPVCGGGLPHRICEAGGVPTWAFHGDKDDVVPISESIKMIEATKRCGIEAILTTYEGGHHNAWDATYSNPEIYKWLLQHKKN
ncbi:MAG: hydrolase [Ignavibacteriaceae bacterium]|nr:MAG: hydrolase [Ignavibacteriaceae bacterium]